MLKHKGYRNNKGKIERISLVDDALKEVYLLSKLDHINIIGLHEIITENGKKKVYLIVKYAENGPIMTFTEEKAEFHINQAFSDKGRLDYKEEELKQFSKDIALAIQYRKQRFKLSSY
jgi:serine/threonine protein kinase